MTIMFRRGLLTGAAALAAGVTTGGSGRAAVPTTTAPHSDAELLAACAAFDALERTFQGADPEEWDKFDALGNRIRAEQEPHRDVILNFEATTPAGHAARARSYLLWMDTTPDALLESADDGEQMLGALLADLTGQEAVS